MFFKKLKKLPRRMAHGKQQPKFERNLCLTFRDNCDTDDGWTTDGQRTDDGQISIL